MKQIFTNHLFNNAVKEIPLKEAKLKFSCSYNEYEIWELSEQDFALLDSFVEDIEESVSDHVWKENWGWWRWCNGSTIETSPTHLFYINNIPVNLYYSQSGLVDFADLLIQADTPDEDRWPYMGPVSKDVEEEYFSEYGFYQNIFNYCQEIWDCANPGNVAAIIIANAKLNNLAPSDFMQKLS